MNNMRTLKKIIEVILIFSGHYSGDSNFDIEPVCLLGATDFEQTKRNSRVVLVKRSSDNMQQIYRRTPMQKYDFNKIAFRMGVLL